MYTLLCNLCESGNAISHNNWLGYIGFAVVAGLLINDTLKKQKAKKEKATKQLKMVLDKIIAPSFK